MKENFLPYKESLALQELGFDEDVFEWYNTETEDLCDIMKEVRAPLYQQAFKWFREKFSWEFSIMKMPEGAIYASKGSIKPYAWHISNDHLNPTIPSGCFGHTDTYEEAQLACIQKMIELVNK